MSEYIYKWDHAEEEVMSHKDNMWLTYHLRISSLVTDRNSERITGIIVEGV